MSAWRGGGHHARDRRNGGRGWVGEQLTDARSSLIESALILMDGEDSGSGGGL